MAIPAVMGNTQASSKPVVEWLASAGPVPYPGAVAAMDDRVAAIARGAAGECVWLLDHPALYTAGTSADPAELLDPDRFPVFRSGRGGRFTYHGPGQRVIYVMFDLACGVLHGLSNRRVEASIGKGRLVRGSGTRRSPACESRRGRCAT